MKPGVVDDGEDSDKMGFMDIDPLELARQLTLLEFELFKTIKPTEFLDQAWLSKDKEKLAPGIMSMTKWSTRVSSTILLIIDY